MSKNKKLACQIRNVFFGLAATGLLSGCMSPVALDQSFIGYAETYADVTNEQMLLNLARRANNHPFYFLQLGSINSSFQFGAGLNNSGGITNNSGFLYTAAAKVMGTYTGALSLNASEQPVFSITPLSGSGYAQAIYKPLDMRLFYEQLAHGVPMDMLLRLMIHSIWLEFPSGKMLALTNVPDKESPVAFRNYLRLAAMFRELQKDGALVVNQDEKGESSLVFTLKSEASLARLRADEKYTYWEGMKDLSDEKGFPKITFIPRSFSGVLSAMGQEQKLFETWSKSSRAVQDSVPVNEYRPIIKILWSSDDKTTKPISSISYYGNDYKVVDPDDGSTWNRDAFVLLAALFEMVAMDPKSLPMQQLIQVR